MSAARVINLLETVSQTTRCMAHGGKSMRLVQNTPIPANYELNRRRTFSDSPEASRSTDYAFEMTCSNIRYGIGVTEEVGMDVNNLKSKRLCVFTDSNLVNKSPVKMTLDSIHKHNHGNGLQVEIYDQVRVEPTDTSILQAIDFAKKGNFDCYVGVGGGSVLDTCKAANLYACAPEGTELLDYVNRPLGKGKSVTFPLKPFIAVPTTSGTGSETTGTSIFDHEPSKAKTGISDRAIRPLLGILDPLHTQLMPERVAAYSGFDVLCHALESYTALPYQDRHPRPDNPINRPAYQGSNPISDIWSLHALRIIAKYFKRSVFDAEDLNARSEMHLASTFAGVGFGNAGCHLCHAMSYPISGNVKSYRAKQYNVDHPLVPHGLSVVMTAPAVFNFTASMCPERHLEAAEILGADVKNARKDDAGRILSDTLCKIMNDLLIDDGLAALGYTYEDIPQLTKGTLPQHRILKLSPRQYAEEDISSMLENSLKVY